MAQDGRVALVSVANRGIGREVVVRELAEEGNAVNLGLSERGERPEDPLVRLCTSLREPTRLPG